MPATSSTPATGRRAVDPELPAGLSSRPAQRAAGAAFAVDANGALLPPSPRDVDQGQLGDCWLMASAAAVAHTHPEAIIDRIREDADGQYTVRLGPQEQVVPARFPAGLADTTPGVAPRSTEQVRYA